MKKTIANTISQKIAKGEVKMRSRISILMGKLGMGGGVTLVLGFLVLIVGFVLYWFNTNNDLLFGGYGKYGFLSFIHSFPYILVGAFILLFIFLTFIFRRYDFSYKKPFLAILILVLCAIGFVGYLSIRQPIGQRFYQKEGNYFRMGMINNANAISGVVTKVGNNLIVIKDENNKDVTILFDSNTHFPFGAPKMGDAIRSVGAWDGNSFNAQGIRVFNPNDPTTFGPGMMRGGGRGMMRNQ